MLYYNNKNLKILILLIILFLIITKLYSQENKVRSFQLENFLKTEKINKNEQVSFFVKANKNELLKEIELNKGTYKGKIKDWNFISLPKNNIKSFLNNTNIKAINFRTYKGQTFNDTMRVNNRINSIHQGLNPLKTSYTGNGVIVGFIDTGIDWRHPDFINPLDSSTRILYVWDQTLPSNQYTPSKYGYGQHWDSTQIMQGLCINNDQYGHGSTVSGAACGNGFANGLNKGVAPNAEIIAVESNFNASNWLSTVVDAVEYIYNIADSLQKPCVINASVGTYLGSHDGLDPYTLYIDSLINSKKGHLMVASAGNSGNLGKYHLETTINNDTSFTWFNYNPSSNYGDSAVFFEIWADTANFNQIQYAVGLDKTTPYFENRGKGNFYNISHNLNSVTYDTIKNQNNQQLATVQYWSELRDGQYLLQVYLPTPDSIQYNFRFETIGTGKFDIWSSSLFGMSDIVTYNGGINNFIEINKYKNPDSLKTIVSSFQCSPSVITVGNYYNDSGYVNLDSTWTSNGGIRGKIAETSSRGPTRDNRIKPEITATGDVINAPIPLSIINYYINHPTLDSTLAIGGMHRRNGGTSMSSPIVAGVGALLLEKCNKITTSEFKNALILNAYSDNYTGTLPNNSFGYGKLDGFNTLLHTSYQNNILGNLEFCQGDSTMLNISNNNITHCNWNNTDTTLSLYISENSNNYLITTNQQGCKSDTLYFQTTQHPIPQKPNITIYLDSIKLHNTNGNNIQWYYNENLIPSENESSIYIHQNGSYYAIITNQYGCTEHSDTIDYNSVGINELEAKYIIYPNPTRNIINMKSKSKIKDTYIYNARGKIVVKKQNINKNYTSINISHLPKGIYYAKLLTDKFIYVKKIVLLSR